MPAWRDILPRFRKLVMSRPAQAAVTVLEAPAAIAMEHESGTMPEFASVTGAATQPDSDATHQFGDTTRSLTASAPQLATLLGERMLGAAALRDIGRERRENQDHCFAQVLTLPTDSSTLTLGLFVVADGMGGHHDGGYASKLALTTVVSRVLEEFITPLMTGEQRAPQPVMQAAVQAANVAVYAAAEAAGSDMGTTCTAALLYDQEVITAHVGDSRALLIGGTSKQLTTDHSAVGRLLAIGAITPDEAQEHPLRNKLYRSIGQQADVSVDVKTTPLNGASHLVLCSDGLWSLVSDTEIADIVTEAPTPHIAARHLIARANMLGGHDNISVVVAALPAGAGA